MVEAIVSFFIVAFGQSAWIGWLGPVAACSGYALFWRGLKERRFWPAVVWFTAVSLVQISWMATPDYMPGAMIVVYVLLCIGMGLQFGIVTLLIDRPFAMAGAWVLLEASRLFLFTGFPWNPAGLALATQNTSIQFAAVFGVYGLSFWVMLVNGLLFQKKWAAWALCAIFPYVFGVVQQQIVERVTPNDSSLSVALVQTGLLPDEKMPMRSSPGAFVPALWQWERAIALLKPDRPVDLIVFPEAAFPLEVHKKYHSAREVEEVWKRCFGQSLPPLDTKRVSNGWIAQKLADQFGAAVIAGFEDFEEFGDRCAYNAAFLFAPNQSAQRYEKQILVPGGEYVPDFVPRELSERFGVGASFDAGHSSKLFYAKVPLGISICSEEVYSHLLREQKKQGAGLFVSISNDGWYPRSTLARQHFEHGRIRAAENGTPLVRSCNMGITGAIDCFGKSVGQLTAEDQRLDVLYVDVPLRSFPTLYTLWGDRMIFILGLLCLLLL